MNKNKELISIIMSTYNESIQHLKLSIESILNQTYENIEFIIVQDNPKNSDIRNLLLEYKNKDVRIKLIYNEKNLGLVASLNKALEEINGKYVARMDSDDIAIKNRLENQMEYVINNNVDILGGGVSFINKNGQVVKEYRKNSNINPCIKLYKSNTVPHPTWLVKAEVYKNLNGYRNVDLCEDYDFLIRAKIEGYLIDNLNEEILKYRLLENSLSRKNGLRQFKIMKKIQSGLKNKKIYSEKNLNSIETNDREELNYKKANKYFLESSLFFKRKKFFKSIYKLIKSCFYSKYIIIKIIDVLFLKFRSTY